MGANVLVEFEKMFLIGGQIGANVLVEFKNFFNWGVFFYNWGQKIILGSRKSAILGIIWTPVRYW